MDTSATHTTRNWGKGVSWPLMIVLLTAAAVMALLWGVPGLDMYPLDDGWVSFSSGRLDFNWPDFFLGNSRELRYVPYLIARTLESDGFRTINIILIGLDLSIFVGLFAVFHVLLDRRRVPAFVAAGLAMLFPGDHTMFWLGAFGVNVSYALLVWATYFGLVAIDRNSLARQACGLVLFYCGIRTYSGYVFLPLVFVGYYVFATFGWRGLLRGFARHSLPQLLVFSLAFAPTMIGLAAGSGREGHVASLELAPAFDGYVAMFANLGYGWIRTLAGLLKSISIPATLALLALFTAAVWALGTRRDDPQDDRRQTRSRVALVLACLAVIVLCYLPFSVSDVRFNAARALMGSRAGYFLLLVALADWVYRRLPQRAYSAWAFALLGVGLLTAFGAASQSLFQARSRQSLYQRVFLADLAAVVPCAPAQALVIVAGPKVLGRNTGGSMLVNRPQFPIRTMYGNHRVQARVITNFMLMRGGRLDPSDGTVIYKRADLGSNSLLLRYSFATGFEHVNRVVVRVGHKRKRVVIHGSELPGDACRPTPLMQSLLRDRPRYLQALGLHR
jgi:hypothetical protein